MAGSALAISVVAACAAAALALSTVGAASVRSHQVAGIADSAALAAADAASGAIPGYACERAEQVAAAFDTRLTGCQLDGLVATVAVAGAFGPFPVVVRSRAGPPP